MKSESFLRLRTFGLLAAVLAFLGAGRAEAQASFGVGAGLNFSSLNDVDFGSASTTYDRHQGYHIGIFVDLNAGPIAVRPGVYYVNAGPLFEGLDDVNTETIEDNFDLNFISVPVDLRLQLPLPFVKPYALLGPEFLFLTDTDAGGDLEGAMEDVTFAGNVGLGVVVDMPLVGVKLYPEFRYGFSVSGLVPEDTELLGAPASKDQRVNMFLIRVGVGF